MKQSTFRDALKNRRSCYDLEPQGPATEKDVEDILEFALNNVPSAFNSQSTRLVLLMGDHYKKFWSIVLETLRKIVPEKAFPQTEAKIASFAAGYGTVLFYEDMAVIEKLQADFAAYKDNFPPWSRDTNGMHQLTVWSMLEDAGLGASLQHYNPIIDAEVAKTWNIDSKWKLIAQMPFGGVTEKPAAKDKLPIKDRLKKFL